MLLNKSYLIYLVFMSKTYLGVVYFEDVTLICFSIRLFYSKKKIQVIPSFCKYRT